MLLYEKGNEKRGIKQRLLCLFIGINNNSGILSLSFCLSILFLGGGVGIIISSLFLYPLVFSFFLVQKIK